MEASRREGEENGSRSRVTLIGKTKDRTGSSLALLTPTPHLFHRRKNPRTISGQVKYFVEVSVFSPTGFEAGGSGLTLQSLENTDSQSLASHGKARQSPVQFGPFFLSTPSPPPIRSRHHSASELCKTFCQGLLPGWGRA